ncbi:hypothetical protein LRP52_48805 [Photobacterium sp. ZSDE20]|uniref:Uncharacterized protein n=1 Tax=Photobacterium pectinilyticum TaxID=2906793 RepID=A0ABT1NCF5_9GAMM|nr:hypothetical protein [Photobacterium sp. ZSDE20]MCQ1061346.1 hypothetical protein [Photobacterium sp. ZSDE20]MDD1830040.1 hypothetical protein [Photobacterium sp. ZSDE20]
MKLTMGMVSKDGSFDIEPVNSLVMPIGAAPESKMPQSATGEDLKAIKVLVGDEVYPSSNAYKALFLAALVATKRSVTDVLITVYLSISFMILIEGKSLFLF